MHSCSCGSWWTVDHKLRDAVECAPGSHLQVPTLQDLGGSSSVEGPQPLRVHALDQGAVLGVEPELGEVGEHAVGGVHVILAGPEESQQKLVVVPAATGVGGRWGGGGSWWLSY
jgi:hypothetical protein